MDNRYNNGDANGKVSSPSERQRGKVKEEY